MIVATHSYRLCTHFDATTHLDDEFDMGIHKIELMYCREDIGPSWDVFVRANASELLLLYVRYAAPPETLP